MNYKDQRQVGKIVHDQAKEIESLREQLREKSEWLEAYKTSHGIAINQITDYKIAQDRNLEQLREREELMNDWARKIIAARDAYLEAMDIDDYHEVYHHLYTIASPDFSLESDKVWADLEQKARAAIKE